MGAVSETKEHFSHVFLFWLHCHSNGFASIIDIYVIRTEILSTPPSSTASTLTRNKQEDALHLGFGCL